MSLLIALPLLVVLTFALIAVDRPPPVERTGRPAGSLRQDVVADLAAFREGLDSTRRRIARQAAETRARVRATGAPRLPRRRAATR